MNRYRERAHMRDARKQPVAWLRRTFACRDNEEADHRHDELPAVAGPASGKLPWFFSNGTEWPRPSSRLSRLPNLWPDPQARHDDRIVAQLMYLPPGYKGQRKSTSES
ncbi:hypothetical protein HPB48_018364 [Haemaphysalis longicornis]|uniref:Uncharacterized protein n=1 Tax=Haemaphysalis longicornis TaxID=44386 RepID=A0A9J6GET4_HAELO|nr:hypothetical protein HPB48_018364 [Haemaphysalis longicornis]